jgi:hypothetical protein
MKKAINVQPIVTAFDGTVSAYGALKKAVQDAFKGCKNAEQYKARRIAVYAEIDKAVSDKKKAKAVKASVNTTLARILPEEVKLGVQKGGRKARAAEPKAAQKASKQASASKQAQAPLHDMTSLLAAITAIAEKSSKADCLAMRDRIANQFAAIIAKK